MLCVRSSCYWQKTANCTQVKSMSQSLYSLSSAKFSKFLFSNYCDFIDHHVHGHKNFSVGQCYLFVFFKKLAVFSWYQANESVMNSAELLLSSVTFWSKSHYCHVCWLSVFVFSMRMFTSEMFVWFMKVKMQFTRWSGRVELK